MQKNIVFIFSLFALISCSNENIQDVVKSYIAAHNTHDINRSLTFFDENIEFELKGVWIKEGLSEMKSLAEWDAALNSNLKLESMSSNQDTVFCRIVENNDWFGAIEITDLVHDPVVFIVNDKAISKIIAYPSPKTGKEVEAAIVTLFKWSAEAQDTTIHDLIQNGQFVYSTEAAKKWLNLFERRKKSEDIR